ncbi:MAG: hypothetical protein LBG94_10750 [Treponema sp.]|nr:hypothetical protein [Treponema sp.]
MMTNEPEYRDANPGTENLPGRGRSIILLIAGGIALAILTIAGLRIRPLGLAVGVFTFVSGLTMLVRRRTFNYRPGVIVTICGFFLLLANPRFGLVAGFAGFFLIIGAVGLVVFGLFRAIKLAWELGRFS